MNKTKLNKVIEDGNIVIPIYILKFFKKFNLSMEEFIFLMYLYNKQDKIDFNPDKIATDLNIDIMEVMGYISVLTDKGYLTLDVFKDNNNVLEEIINLAPFYEKISMLLLNNHEDNNDDNKSLLKYIEEELGRPLNSIEIKTIESWTSNQIDSSLIKEALWIALRDGVFSLKYIDKILFDWKSRGFQTIDDVKKSYEMNNNQDNVEIELEDWNWLDDEEEYITN